MTRTACTNLPTKLYGAFSYPGSNPLNFGDYEVEDEGLPFDIRRRNIMRNTVFMVNMCFSGEYFEVHIEKYKFDFNILLIIFRVIYNKL